MKNTKEGIFIMYNKVTGCVLAKRIGVLTEYDFDPSTHDYIELGKDEETSGKRVDIVSRELVPQDDLPYTTTGRPVADASTEYILALPEGTIYDNNVVEDNSLEFTFDEPGPFVISLTNPLYSPLELTINVEAT
jgi:hypothetical protein